MVTIRPATPDDADEICRVHVSSIRELGGSHYSDEAVEAWAAYPSPEKYPLTESADSGEHFVVAERDTEIVGFAQLDIGAAEVDKVYGSPDCARNGIGSALMAHIEDVARKYDINSLYVEASRNAVPFYESMGYERTGERKKTLKTENGTIEFEVVDMEKRL